MYSHGSTMLYFLVYVDDLLHTGNDQATLTWFQDFLSSRFSLKELGDVNYFLGIEVIPTSTGYILSQHKYMVDVLQRFLMTDAKAVDTPLAASTSLTLQDCSPPTDATRYRQALGALQYLVSTRPDIAYSVNKLSQYMHAPSSSHWQCVKRLLRYVSGTLTCGLSIRRSNAPLRLSAFADSAWVGNLDDRSSTSGYLVYFCSTLISWRSQKQRTVARSIPRHNIVPLPMPPLNCNGCRNFSLSYAILYLLHLPSTPTISAPPTSAPIRSFILA
ncbi:unnamed protein product [Linum trigynum]|uniref:Reverse transcriptase Ty1/copia-type domain-containing protein n=1 Tax=Linum trigynum TaxID=586398 RepID=A0AAV2GAP4_9ROSI